MRPEIMSSRTYVITGAASGLGSELSRRFSLLGCRLILVDKNAEKLELLRAKLPEETTETIVFDLANTAEIDNRFSGLLMEKKETLFGLINCAAEEHDGFFDDIPLEAVRRNMDINFWAPLILSRIVAPILKEKGEGEIITIISDMAYRSVPGRMPYSSSKAALKIFCECLRMELEPYNVRGISIFPGVMKTPFWTSVVTYPRMVPPPPDMRPVQTASTVADHIMKKLKKKLVIRQFNLTKVFLFLDAIFPTIGDKIIYRAAKTDRMNL